MTRLAEDRYRLVTGAGAIDSDLGWLELARAGDDGVQLRDVTEEHAVIGLWGPRARDVLRELYRIGALDTEAYAADSFLTKKHPEPTDPKVHDRVKQLSDQALALSQAQLDKNPNNVDALYARGITRGLRATYMGMGEKAWFAALRSAVSARHDHERVLELDPKIR